jgi:vitellogenic carboxypeptidase-like protein
VTAHADTAYFMGYIDPRQRLRAMTMQLEAVRMIAAGGWAGGWVGWESWGRCCWV